MATNGVGTGSHAAAELLMIEKWAKVIKFANMKMN